jgi:V8-like Glu-specific endopeptidase
LKNKIVALYDKGAKHDYALLKLEKNVERTQYFNLFQDLDSLPKLTVCGYSDSDALMSHSNNPTLNNDGIISYDIDTAGGQSGSPLFEVDEDDIRLVGVHKGFCSRQKLNIATVITAEMVADLNQWMLEMGIVFKLLNPAANQSKKYLESTEQLQEVLDKV